MEKTVHPAPLDHWIQWLKKEIVWNDLSEDLIRSFLLHLADLEIFVTDDNGRWNFVFFKEDIFDPDRLTVITRKHLEKIGNTPKGFVVGYFLKTDALSYKPQSIPEELRYENEPSASRSKEYKIPSKTLDLSNLQIVKKVGRQLSPFLEIENKWVQKLTGKFTPKEDARKIFKFVFSKLGPKGTPLPWQQLSRRRHK